MSIGSFGRSGLVEEKNVVDETLFGGSGLTSGVGADGRCSRHGVCVCGGWLLV